MSHPVAIFAAVLIPVTCPLCGAAGPSPCDVCLAALPLAHDPPPIPGLGRLTALFAYEGGGRELVAALKYRNARAVAGRLAALLVADLLVTDVADVIDVTDVADVADVATRPDVVTWVPAAPSNRRSRGYDQGQVLARRVGRRLRVPTRRLLRRRGAPQTASDRASRLAGPDLAARRRVRGHVLVVDDVATTGASLARAAAALDHAGADRVDAAVVAVRADRTFGISKLGPGVLRSRYSSPSGG